MLYFSAGETGTQEWGAARACFASSSDDLCVPRGSVERMSETAGSRTPAPAPSGKLGAAQPQAQLPSEVVTSQEQQPVISPAPGTPGVLWRSPEEPSLLPQTPETAQPSREDLFFQGQPTTLGVSGPLSPYRPSSLRGRPETATTNPSSYVVGRIYGTKVLSQWES